MSSGQSRFPNQSSAASVVVAGLGGISGDQLRRAAQDLHYQHALNQWMQYMIFSNVLWYKNDMDKVIQHILASLFAFLELWELFVRMVDVGSEAFSLSEYVRYSWSFASSFGTEFASDNAGDGPKRLLVASLRV